MKIKKIDIKKEKKDEDVWIVCWKDEWLFFSVLFLSTTKDKRAELPFQPDNLND